MSEVYQPHPYQVMCTEHVLKNPACALFVDMGLGKTSITLVALVDLLFDRLECSKVLVVAPKRVAAHTWPAEVAKWTFSERLRVSVLDGTEKRRIKRLSEPADIYTISRDNLAWLVAHLGRRWPFDVLVLDELSSFKNPGSKRFKALRKVRAYSKRVIGLTGTPAPRSLLDLWAQLYLLDRGDRLGKTITAYKEHYFRPGAGVGYVVYDWKLRKGAAAEIHAAVSDICISLKASDYLDLPGRTDQIVRVPLEPAILEGYNELKREQLLQLSELEVITAANAAVVVNKLQQYCNGASYVEAADGSPAPKGKKPWREIHDAKIEAVREDLEALNGEPFLLFYLFQHDRERILARLGEFEPRVLDTAADMDAWNAGQVPFAIAHPASLGHGLNLQHGGHYFGWFSIPWDLELFQQANKRIDRQGQKFHVIGRLYLVPGSIEFEILKRLNSKDATQTSLLDAVRVMVREVRAERRAERLAIAR